MSRAGRAHGPVAKKRELHHRLQAAVAEAQAPEPEPVEMPPEVVRQWAAHRLAQAVQQKIRMRDRALWPGEIQGAIMAEHWFALMQARAMEAAQEGMRERAAAAGLVIPS